MPSTNTGILPLVSVIIPCYNAEKYILEAIESVLNQTYQQLEVIVVDDGSNDDSYSVLQSFGDKIKLLTHADHLNRGVSVSRKRGIEEAKGVWIAFLDSDDYWEPTKISYQIAKLEQYPKAVLCHTNVKIFYDEGFDKKDFRHDFTVGKDLQLYDLLKFPFYLTNNRICNSSVMVKRALLADVSLDAPQLYQFEDWLLWVLLACKGPFLYLQEPATVYRFHNSSFTAGLVKNRLINSYAHIEFLLTLISRVDDPEVQRQIVDALQGDIFSLLGKYNEELSGDDKYRLVALLLGRADGELGYLSTALNKYKSRVDELQHELIKAKREISNYRTSRLHRLVERFSFWRSN